MRIDSETAQIMLSVEKQHDYLDEIIYGATCNHALDRDEWEDTLYDWTLGQKKHWIKSHGIKLEEIV